MLTFTLGFSFMWISSFHHKDAELASLFWSVCLVSKMKSNSAGQMSKHDNHWCVFLFVSESCSSVLRGLCVLPFLFFPTERASTSGNPYRHICLCTPTFCLSWWNQETGFDITNGLMAGEKKYLWKVDLNTAGLFKTVIYWIGHRWPKFTWSKLAEGNLYK